MKILRFAVIGDPIQHSLSPLIHMLFAKQTGIKLRYEKILVNSSNLSREINYFFASGGYGLNITSPHKEDAYKLSNIKSYTCEQARAANTLWIKNHNRLILTLAAKSALRGETELRTAVKTQVHDDSSTVLTKKSIIYADNTDGYGLISDLQRFINLTKKRILVLGSGGAVRGFIPALLNSFVEDITILCRSKEKAYKLNYDFGSKIIINDQFLKSNKYDIIINTLPKEVLSETVGLVDETISKSTLCYDLNYNLQNLTNFLSRAKRLNVAAKDGIGMLVYQAAKSFEIWHGILPNASDVIKKLTFI